MGYVPTTFGWWVSQSFTTSRQQLFVGDWSAAGAAAAAGTAAAKSAAAARRIVMGRRALVISGFALARQTAPEGARPVSPAAVFRRLSRCKPFVHGGVGRTGRC